MSKPPHNPTTQAAPHGTTPKQPPTQWRPIWHDPKYSSQRDSVSTKGTTHKTTTQTPPTGPDHDPMDRGKLASTFGTLLSSQGTDTPEPGNQSQPQDNPTNLRHPSQCPISGTDQTRAPRRPRVAHGPDPANRWASVICGSLRRDRPPRGVRSSLPGDGENIRQALDRSQIALRARP